MEDIVVYANYKPIKNVLDVEVSCFKNYTTPHNPKKVNLLTWLWSNKHKEKVEIIRKTKDKQLRKKLKSQLPAITPSGIFTYRSEKCLVAHSGLIHFDIDKQDNDHIKNYDKLKEQICNLEYVAYCGKSVSGNGYWGLVPIPMKNLHKYHFKALVKAFKRYGINLDTKPQNISSLRGYSFDEEAYFNFFAKDYWGVEVEPMSDEDHLKMLLGDNYTPPNYKSIGKFETTQDKVEGLIQLICNARIDLTPTYKDWFQIACSLANEFGERGRIYFHQVSQFYPNYQATKTDKQYDACLRNNYKITIGTFFYYCKNANIELNAN